MATTVTSHIATPLAVEVSRVITVDGAETSRMVVATLYDPAIADLVMQALGTQTVED